MKKIIAFLAVAVLMIAGGTSARAGSGVGEELGKTYGWWSAKWWQWEEATEPLLEEDAVDCSEGQKGPVWFLAGVGFDLSGEAVTRTCDVKRGKRLFFPLVNLVFYNGPDEDYSVEEKFEILDDIFSDQEPGALEAYACNMSATVNEVPVIFKGYPIVRVQSPPFKYEGDPQAISDGSWVMLPPLPEGINVIHFTGAYCEFDTAPGAKAFILSVDVTYNITVGR